MSTAKGPTRLVRLNEVVVPLSDEADDHETLLKAAAKRLRLPTDAISELVPLRRAIDTRSKPRLVYHVLARVPAAGRYSGTLPKGVTEGQLPTRPRRRRAPASATDRRVVVVGAGPAGLFAALELAESGLRHVTLVEQGKPVEARGQDVSRLMNYGELELGSNLCFGEGGAGTWSDGKLTTRINAPQIRYVLETLVELGGQERILLDGKPHLGTNKLVEILKRFRARLTDRGVTLRFGERVDRLRLGGHGITGVKLEDGETIECDDVVLALGHSSRRLYATVVEQGVGVELKASAVGFRVEHPQHTINALQYGRHAQKPSLPPADYKLTANVQVDGAKRGVYSFCMCPGGQVVPTPTEHGGVVVNGMSHASRSGAYANSALVVTVDPSDYGSLEPMAGVDFQRRAEERAGALGGGLFRAPAQNVQDFLRGTEPRGELAKSTYRPGLTPADLTLCYPAFVTDALRLALARWARRLPAFVSAEAMLIGVETRTSAPLRIVRAANFESVTTPGLFPCGEGAGYAGGIVSSAVDGLRVAGAILDRLGAEVVDTTGSDR